MVYELDSCFPKESCANLQSHLADVFSICFKYTCVYMCILCAYTDIFLFSLFHFALGYNHIKCPDLRLRRFSKENAGCYRSWFSGWYPSF